MITTILLASFNWGCIWPLLLASILPFILGYWFRHTLSGREREALRQKEDEYLRLKSQFNTLEKDMASVKYEKGELEKEQTALRTTLRSVEADRAMLRARMEEESGQYDPNTDRVAGRLRLGGGGLTDHSEEDLKTLRPIEYHRMLSKDNLQIIEGLTPKAERVLKDKGIPSWSRLASASQGELNAHLGSEGLSNLDPSTWPEQAGLARDHRWNDLAALQRSIREGEPARVDQVVFGVSQDRKATIATKEGDLPLATLFAEDNLQIIEGIGPKVNTLLNDQGYTTWKALAAAKVDDLRKILNERKLNMIKPDSWPRQAELADRGQWDDLIAYQKALDGGRDGGNGDTPAKVEVLAMKLMGFRQDPEDLKIVEGIGPKIEKLLKDDGINTWEDLAKADLSRLEAILAKAGKRYRLAKPATWPRQARLAADAKWGELKEYQDKLRGGRE